METVFRLNTVEHSNSSTCLKDILKWQLKKVHALLNTKNKISMNIRYNFLTFLRRLDNGTEPPIILKPKKSRFFRCDRIQSVNATALFKGKPIEEFKRPADKLYKDGSATEFQVTVSEKGVDLFYKEHYPSMQLCSEMGCHVIKGFYNRDEQKLYC